MPLGASDNKPFCDGTHGRIDVDLTESAPTESTRSVRVPGRRHGHEGRSGHLVREVPGTQKTNAWKMMQDTDDTRVRSQAMAMIELAVRS